MLPDGNVLIAKQHHRITGFSVSNGVELSNFDACGELKAFAGCNATGDSSG